MPIQFITGSYKGVTLARQADVYRMLHLAFDHGFLFEAAEIEKIWAARDPIWRPLPEKDDDLWTIIEKAIDPVIAGNIQN